MKDRLSIDSFMYMVRMLARENANAQSDNKIYFSNGSMIDLDVFIANSDVIRADYTTLKKFIDKFYRAMNELDDLRSDLK